jgi:hypothetical protein
MTKVDFFSLRAEWFNFNGASLRLVRTLSGEFGKEPGLVH